jgi:hypothetical protein
MNGFKNIEAIKSYILEVTGMKVHIEKRRGTLYFYYINGDEVGMEQIYQDVCYLTHKQLEPLVKLLNGNTVPYYE